MGKYESAMTDYIGSNVRADFMMTLAHGAIAALVTLLVVAGIRLVINMLEEFAYMEAGAKAPRWAIKLAVRVAYWSGFEPMPEEECPSEMLPHDRARVWFAQRC